MYDELVKRLRTECTLPFQTLQLMREAADAIEELQKLLDGVEADNDSLCADLERSKEWEAFWEKEANEALKKFQTTVASMPRWIPVTERLPEKNGSYLVYVYGEATEMNYWHGKWHRLGDDYTKAVTHWMPLPEPPKEV